MTPAERAFEVWRVETSPGAGWCFGGCRQQLSLPVLEPSPVFPRPCLLQAAGHCGVRLQQRR